MLPLLTALVTVFHDFCPCIEDTLYYGERRDYTVGKVSCFLSFQFPKVLRHACGYRPPIPGLGAPGPGGTGDAGDVVTPGCWGPARRLHWPWVEAAAWMGPSNCQVPTSQRAIGVWGQLAWPPLGVDGYVGDIGWSPVCRRRPSASLPSQHPHVPSSSCGSQLGAQAELGGWRPLASARPWTRVGPPGFLGPEVPQGPQGSKKLTPSCGQRQDGVVCFL